MVSFQSVHKDSLVVPSIVAEYSTLCLCWLATYTLLPVSFLPVEYVIGLGASRRRIPRHLAMSSLPGSLGMGPSPIPCRMLEREVRSCGRAENSAGSTQRTMTGMSEQEVLWRNPTSSSSLSQMPHYGVIPMDCANSCRICKSQDFRKWESCRTMSLVGGFSRRYPVSPAPSYRRRSILASITLIGSQDLAVKSRTHLFPHSPLECGDVGFHGVATSVVFGTAGFRFENLSPICTWCKIKYAKDGKKFLGYTDNLCIESQCFPSKNTCLRSDSNQQPSSAVVRRINKRGWLGSNQQTHLASRNFAFRRTHPRCELATDHVLASRHSLRGTFVHFACHLPRPILLNVARRPSGPESPTRLEFLLLPGHLTTTTLLLVLPWGGGGGRGGAQFHCLRSGGRSVTTTHSSKYDYCPPTQLGDATQEQYRGVRDYGTKGDPERTRQQAKRRRKTRSRRRREEDERTKKARKEVKFSVCDVGARLRVCVTRVTSGQQRLALRMRIDRSPPPSSEYVVRESNTSGLEEHWPITEQQDFFKLPGFRHSGREVVCRGLTGFEYVLLILWSQLQDCFVEGANFCDSFTLYKLYVGNLAAEVNEGALRQLFQEQGLSCTTILVKRGGYAFVECTDQSAADKAIDKLNAKEEIYSQSNVLELRPNNELFEASVNMTAITKIIGLIWDSRF
ncbi:hypothetical protein PR048_027933 [Dryococelus australis]|uniref:RRM domain-containing protein n=1 Tax=Dryococelus australis TaxID=614101 RepID=A0ABQ9GHW2_9NEOP|nr:hypothetical protein PR048_027933 [Dryococelus australis]